MLRDKDKKRISEIKTDFNPEHVDSDGNAGEQNRKFVFNEVTVLWL